MHSSQRRDVAGWRRLGAALRAGALDELVVKAVGESGGYGMLIGPHSTTAEREDSPGSASSPIHETTSRSRRWRCLLLLFRRRADRAASRRPAADILSGEKTVIVPGGLTRRAS